MSKCIHGADISEGELPPGWETDDGIEEFYTGCGCCGMWMNLMAHGIINHETGETLCDTCAAPEPEGRKP